MKKTYALFLLVFLLSTAFWAAKVKAESESGYSLTEDQRIDISLSYLPKNPVNNPDNPIELTVSASVLASKSSDDLEYTWRVYGSTEKKDPSEWEEILKKDLLNVSDMSGYGLSKLKFKLAFKDGDLHYIRVKLNIKEKNDNGNTNTREGNIVIPLNSVSNELAIYSASIQNDRPIMTDALCGNTEDLSCVVNKGEIIGLKIDSKDLSDFSWKIDGEQIEYAECPMDKCNSNEAFIPITKEKQETYEVAVSATVKDTGKRVTFNRTLTVSEPKASIESLDKTTCEPIIEGYFRDLDDNLTPDYSKTRFEAVAGSTIKLTPNFKVKDINNVSWTIDETEINKESSSLYGIVVDNKEYGVVINADGTITFPSDLESGYSFDVTFTDIYTPDNATKKALQRYWGIPADDFYEKRIDATINITVVDVLSSSGETKDISAQKTKPIGLAALISSAPTQLIYLVKIVLISFLLLFSSYFFLSLFPKKQ